MAQQGKAVRRLERERIKIGALTVTVSQILDLLKELVRTANSNPVIGITTAIMVADVAYRFQLITKTAYIGILVAIGASETASVINDIEDLIPSFRKAADASQPSAQTIVYGDAGKVPLTQSDKVVL